MQNIYIPIWRSQLKAYAEDPAVEIGEYTINQQKDDILMDIYKRQPDILCLSCYIWNLDYIEEIVLEMQKLRPDMPIWLGGPKVSYDAKEVLRRLPCVKGVMKGEGEKTFKEICRIYRNEFEKRENVCGYQDKNVDNSWKKSESVDNQLKGVDGITFREEKRKLSTIRGVRSWISAKSHLSTIIWKILNTRLFTTRQAEDARSPAAIVCHRWTSVCVSGI